jgi:hypothetical protein
VVVEERNIARGESALIAGDCLPQVSGVRHTTTLSNHFDLVKAPPNHVLASLAD